MKRILIIDDVHERLTQGLMELGYEVSYLPGATRSNLLEMISGYEGLVVRTKTEIDEDVLCHAAKLEFIARAGSGVDNIDTDYCDAHGIVYLNAGEANADAVGEHTLAMMLCLFTHIVKADREVRQLIWDREGNRGTELKGKTVGIVGYGHTGKAVARKLSGFGVKVLVHDKYLQGYSDGYANEAEMTDLFEQADVVTFHVPLTGETTGMVNSHYLNRFSKSIFLLNLSRGKVVKLDDLVKEMKSGKVAACALDVLENERLPAMSEEERQVFDQLKNSSRVVLTPHIGGWSSESYEKISTVLLQKIRELKMHVPG